MSVGQIAGLSRYKTNAENSVGDALASGSLRDDLWHANRTINIRDCVVFSMISGLM